MTIPTPSTLFAPAERDSEDEIRKQVAEFAQRHDSVMLKAIPNMFVVLNDKRQIIYANQSVHDLVDADELEGQVYGRRVGEVLGCAHASQTAGGCGTTLFCSTCGAVKAILIGLKGKAATEECRIILRSGDAADLRVWTTPYSEHGRQYVMYAIEDISHEKRRKSLEYVFFHDILNTAGILLSAIELLQNRLVTLDSVEQVMAIASQRLIDEIRSQQILARAEDGELVVTVEMINPLQILADVAEMSRRYTFARGISIVVEGEAQSASILSDRTLLTRVLANMVKNALEASVEGETITLSYHPTPDGVTFSVHSQQYIPPSVQLQVFQRSFSTKGEGRGLGTYSIKLLGERYLKGRVWFETDVDAGTTFVMSCPADISSWADANG